MMHKAWSSTEEVPYCFSRSSVKFQGHTAKKIVEFDPNWAFPDCNSSLGMQPPTRRPDNVTENCTIRGATWHSGTRNSGPKHCEICYMPTHITYQTPLQNMLLNHPLDYLYPCCISHCLTQEMRTFLLFCRVQFIAHCVVVSQTGLGSRENIFVFPRSVAAIWLAYLYYA